MDNTGSLGGNVPVYQLKTLKLGSTKSFEGGNVWANEANPAKIKAEGTLYGKDMSYLVAELPALQIKSGSTVQDNIRSGGPSNQDMEWSAIYPCSYVEQEDPASSGGVEIGDWYPVVYAGNESCNEDSWNETTTIPDGRDSCTDCRVEDYFSNNDDTYHGGEPACYCNGSCGGGSEADKANCPGGAVWDYNTSSGHHYNHVEGNFFVWIKNLFQTNASFEGGNIDNYIMRDGMTRCSNYGDRLPSTYLTSDYMKFMAYSYYEMGGSAGSGWAITKSYSCYFVAVKMSCRDLTRKPAEMIVDCGPKKDEFSSYVLKSR